MRQPAGRKPDPRRGQEGFSLLEAIVVVVLTMALAALTAKSMLSARDNYNLSSTARQIASLAQMARTRAMAHDTRYRVRVNATAGTYRLEVCSSQDVVTNVCNTWSPDPNSADTPLPAKIAFSTTTPVSITTPPPGQGTTVTQATEMTFNSRGLLWDSTANVPANTSCFYLEGNNNRPFAVCSNMVGQTSLYRLYNANWEKQ